ncbi:MAG: LptF/LptG family permease [Sphingobacteriaceae bacterium]|nr:LptF/LptG family permease [Sphingobacteriaceae bacterium]
MKKLHLLLIKAFIRPFIATFLIVMFVLLMLFLFKYIDDLIGKGFDWYIILELLMYASATNVAMALPLAVLLSSIMTFGSLGENYELVAIKSAGVSLRRAMYPLIIVIGLLSVAAFLFSDYMLPVANLKMGSLLWDVRNQKAAFLINEGVFNNSIPGYSIRVDKKDSDGQTLHGVVIYDRVNNSGNVNVVVAESGKMFRTADDSFLILKLKNGIRYEEAPSEKEYNPRLRFTRFGFKETEQKFDLSGFKMQRTDENLFKSNYAMLNMRQLTLYKDSVTRQADTNVLNTLAILKTKYKVLNPGVMHVSSLKVDGITNFDKLPKIERARVAVLASENVRSILEMLSTKVQVDADFNDKLRNFIVEYNRKITLAVSCLVLFFIGAPLGAIIRKGGLGLPVVVSVIFFLFYHIISTVGEKYAKEGDISPVLGMWIAIIVLSPVGAFLTYKASVDSVLFDIDLYKRWFKNLLKKI